jgi:hypothetical protein
MRVEQCCISKDCRQGKDAAGAPLYESGRHSRCVCALVGVAVAATTPVLKPDSNVGLFECVKAGAVSFEGL